MNPSPNNTTPKRGRGAPKGSANAIRHGLKSGTLPPGCKYIEHRLNALRRQLEAAVMAARGQVSIADAANIQTAVQWCRHNALSQRWLKKQYAELKPLDRLAFSREIARAGAEVSRAIAALKLDNEQAAPWLAALPAPSAIDEPTDNGEQQQ